MVRDGANAPPHHEGFSDASASRGMRTLQNRVSRQCCRPMPEESMADQRHVRLFRNGRNQAVCIPVEFELAGDEAMMHRDGDRLVIEPIRKRGLAALLRTMQPIDE